MISPYSHGDDTQVAFVDPLIQRSDLYLAITGNYWFSSIASSGFAHWLPRMVHLDLAVDRRDFPPIKTRFNPPGKRRFVYIGNCFAGKNVGYLTEIARLSKDTEIAWIGNGRHAIRGLRPLGFLDFSTAPGKEVVAGFDFLITVGKRDANPATILEAMAWGLIPVCTPQSGYSGYTGIVNVPADDAPAAAAVLCELQQLDTDRLLELQRQNWSLLESHFTWDRFARQVIEAIECESTPPLGTEDWTRKWTLRWAALHSAYSPLRPLNLARFVKLSLRG
jgi:glycosyltransferase involved in cell wall biosynthesis